MSNILLDDGDRLGKKSERLPVIRPSLLLLIYLIDGERLATTGWRFPFTVYMDFFMMGVVVVSVLTLTTLTMTP